MQIAVLSLVVTKHSLLLSGLRLHDAYAWCYANRKEVGYISCKGLVLQLLVPRRHGLRSVLSDILRMRQGQTQKRAYTSHSAILVLAGIVIGIGKSP